jgi:glycosyltransferase involved in cell wall biosynthesis
MRPLTMPCDSSVAADASWPAMGATLDIAAIIPCFNEAATIAGVISGIRAALPTATIYVYDNNSEDQTVACAFSAGAIVRSEPRRGKGFVVRRMFADIEADVYVMLDGDETYDAMAAPAMVRKLVTENLDMVSGARVAMKVGAFRPAHEFGNRLLTGLVRWAFGSQCNDMLSGYRILSRRFVKSFPQATTGFEIETELTVHALELQIPTAEVEVSYKNRPVGSESKLSTISDGVRILWTIGNLLKQEKPLTTFVFIAALLMALAAFLIYPVIITYLETGLVPRFPTAILATGIVLLAFHSIAAGLILDTVTRGRREAKRMNYLQVPSTLSILRERAR